MMQSEQLFHLEELHGRQAKIYPEPGTDIVFIVFSRQGEIPDYDIYNRVDDEPYWAFLHKCIQQNKVIVAGLGGKGPLAEPVEHESVHRIKISRDFADAGDALVWREKEALKKNVTRDRGALYLVEDEVSGKWSVWLETWADFFARSHTSLSRERIEWDKNQTASQRKTELDAIHAAAAAEGAAEWSKPSTKIVLFLAGALLLWGLIRMITSL